MPNAEVPEAYPVEALRGQVRLLEEQLKDLGTLSQLSPLDTLAELTRDIGEVTKALPPEKKIAIRTISIKSSNRIKVEGTTSDYGAPEELERALRAKKYRAKADAKDLVPGTNEREFTLDIVPKE